MREVYEPPEPYTISSCFCRRLSLLDDTVECTPDPWCMPIVNPASTRCPSRSTQSRCASTRTTGPKRCVIWSTTCEPRSRRSPCAGPTSSVSGSSRSKRLTARHGVPTSPSARTRRVVTMSVSSRRLWNTVRILPARSAVATSSRAVAASGGERLVGHDVDAPLEGAQHERAPRLGRGRQHDDVDAGVDQGVEVVERGHARRGGGELRAPGVRSRDDPDEIPLGGRLNVGQVELLSAESETDEAEAHQSASLAASSTAAASSRPSTGPSEVSSCSMLTSMSGSTSWRARRNSVQ